jgi:hypothetical protein
LKWLFTLQTSDMNEIETSEFSTEKDLIL